MVLGYFVMELFDLICLFDLVWCGSGLELGGEFVDEVCCGFGVVDECVVFVVGDDFEVGFGDCIEDFLVLVYGGEWVVFFV